MQVMAAEAATDKQIVKFEEGSSSKASRGSGNSGSISNLVSEISRLHSHLAAASFLPSYNFLIADDARN